RVRGPEHGRGGARSVDRGRRRGPARAEDRAVVEGGRRRHAKAPVPGALGAAEGRSRSGRRSLGGLRPGITFSPTAGRRRAMPQVKVQDALRLAQQHRDAGRFRQAETIYREILAQRPDHAESHHQLGLLAYQEGRHAEALAPLRRAIALKPRTWSFHTNLGAALAALEHWDEAVTAYRLALELAPARAETHNNLGIAYREQEQL